MNLTPRRSQRWSGSVSQPAGAALRTLILLWAAAQVAVTGLPEPGLHDLDALEAKRSVFYPPPGFMGDHRPGAVIHLAPPLLPVAHGDSWYLWGGSDKFEVSLQRQLESRKGDGPMTTALSSARMWKVHGTGVQVAWQGKSQRSLMEPILLAIVPPEHRGWSYYAPVDGVLIDVPLAPTVVAPETTAEYYVSQRAPTLAKLAGSRPLLLRLTNVALAGLRIPAVREALFAAVDAAKDWADVFGTRANGDVYLKCAREANHSIA
mgnify:CR=1 FL=1